MEKGIEQVKYYTQGWLKSLFKPFSPGDPANLEIWRFAFTCIRSINVTFLFREEGERKRKAWLPLPTSPLLLYMTK